METSKLSSKGQIIIPKQVREAHHWQTGMEFVIESVGDGILLRPRKPFPPTRLEDGLGCAGYSGPAKTLAEMEQGILEDLKRKWLKGVNR
ncbi:transcriptional regulator, AbrB family [Geobacter metallireducens RCH3]|uniref:Antitoxin, AbrB family n=1 Tax=Geobacter metallireducens (strain ATCC 53774 / DSM 7210 / GS-15) TaxID=269799 RepID=Q39W00_GEOMG|nr:AbrB/MazE/SpoVT family DNA-binding domain-containing protein [Geobacter metallireducens]ABB31574.1 antitoxin, AbrB family [Geobacter metallireducens GS-15]EHP86664.1 transcriptional regulator, AbrB family [Geobacter metallireducens RCH3]